MRAVLQRVKNAKVEVEGATVGSIGLGWMVLVGVTTADSLTDVTFLADKIVNLRAFPDGDGKMNLSVQDANGEILVVSQFTLYGDCRKGRRPSFGNAAPPEQANDLYEQLVTRLQDTGISVATGQFQANMQVSLCNDGPVTLLLDSSKQF